MPDGGGDAGPQGVGKMLQTGRWLAGQLWGGGGLGFLGGQATEGAPACWHSHVTRLGKEHRAPEMLSSQ